MDDLPRVLTETPLTLPEAADLLGKPRQTVGTWVRTGVKLEGRRVKLEAVRVGAEWRTSRQAVARFIAACSPVPEPAVVVRPKVSAATWKRLRAAGIKC